ncbi:glutaminase [Capnocytophaga catalasegens]|uniref:Glutaminase n=1 Tax=Capnocytophaga catalasegens TaxID=1004260 RepID=A0AAV5AQN8_9FLAO|nr:glutaminase [Capnocytophaga catalasegens]GIZ15118.1 glutaminase [Capnocytophaga catalasegens]GJM49633.1 glutaminase [Capnocytophaga catalasegens]GJM52698.1 glutaminase [Capnocytophaga catalasegens]
MNYQKIISQIYNKILLEENKGTIPTYIPELARISPEKFGVYFLNLNQTQIGKGDFQEKFSIQSITKVLSMTMAYRELGNDLWKRVGIESSGTSFNSLVQLEADNGIPRNPLINAGAIVVCDILLSVLKNPQEDFLKFVQDVTNNSSINYSLRVANSEKSVGYRNFALCYYIKSLGNIKNNPIDVLDFYFKLCSIEMNCQELAHTFSFLANDGVKPHDGQRILTEIQTKRVNAIMQTCGFYDESGEFAFRVGLPGKSGVGGGIVSVMPNQYSIAVWSPLLNEKGNSYRGMKFLEKFTTQTRISVF